MNETLLPLKALSSSVCIGFETDDWNLDTPAGELDPPRCFFYHVFFDEPFFAPPVVQLGLTGFDTDQCSSQRLKLTLISVTEQGFQVSLSTWRSSRVYSADFQWIAIGS